LRELEHRFPDELVVIGVHSAKYTTERDDRHLAAAVQRLELDHPVVNDHAMRLWQEYAVRAWPTLMFLGPDGKAIGKHEGEFPLEPMAEIIEQMLDEFRQTQMLEPGPFELGTTLEVTSEPLAFPNAVALSDDGTRLYIADTNHHRIVACAADGRIESVIGDGDAGLLDGRAEQARFNHPHGLALDGPAIYVADTGNHAIRRIDLAGGEVTTIAGTGSKAQSYGSGGPALATELNSPWEVAVHDGTLYIAMAGNHQLWLHTLGSDEVRRYAGTGHEGRRDGRVAAAWLAQPSSIAVAESRLLFADAETSSVRTCDLATIEHGMVATLVGQDLFDWGDEDGPLTAALLQHTAGVAGGADVVYVADTYNNKIKRIDLTRGVITTLAGDGEPGHVDGAGHQARFFEPHGLALGQGRLYLADTNNHAIRCIELPTGEVSTLELTP
jgi:hypothetical protein